jgi:cytochrome c
MKRRTFLPLIIVAACAIPGYAQASEVIAKKNGCLACHAIDKKMVGPSYKDIATSYKADKSAASTLAKHVREGSKGIWGATAMPPQGKISDADLASVIDWALKQ